MSVVADELVEPDGAELALEPDLSADVEPLPVLPEDAALDGALGEVLGEVLEPAPAEPLIEPEAEPEGEAVEPDGAVDGKAVEELELPEGAVLVVPPRDAGALSVRSQAASRLAPKATDTAIARVENFMEPP